MSVRNWVVANVPCPVGPVPQEWTHAIYAKLRQYRVDAAIILAGLKLARVDGYDLMILRCRRSPPYRP
jgi:hypothetical protein